MKSILKKPTEYPITALLLAWAMSLGTADLLPAQSPADSSHRWPDTDAVPTPDVRHADFSALPIRTADARRTSNEWVVDSESSVESPVSTDERRTIAPLGASDGWLKPIRDNFRQIDFGRMVGALAIVLGSYLALVWGMRAISPTSSRRLPKEVVEILGAINLAPNQKMQVIRLGSKLLLIVQAPEGIQTVGEITDPVEAEYLTALCQGRQPGPMERPAPRSTPPATTPPPATSNLRRILAQLETALGAETSRTHFEA